MKMVISSKSMRRQVSIKSIIRMDTWFNRKMDKLYFMIRKSKSMFEKIRMGTGKCMIQKMDTSGKRISKENIRK